MRTKEQIEKEIADLKLELKELENKQEWIKIPELKIEVQKRVYVKKVKFKDIVFPKGCRLMTFQEACHLWDNYDYKDFKLGEDKEWIEHYSKKMKEAGYCSALYSSWGIVVLRLNVDGDFHGISRFGVALGCRFVRDLK